MNNAQVIIVYRGPVDQFWGNAVQNGDAVVYGFWFFVAVGVVVSAIVLYNQIVRDRKLGRRMR